VALHSVVAPKSEMSEIATCTPTSCAWQTLSSKSKNTHENELHWGLIGWQALHVLSRICLLFAYLHFPMRRLSMSAIVQHSSILNNLCGLILA